MVMYPKRGRTISFGKDSVGKSLPSSMGKLLLNNSFRCRLILMGGQDFDFGCFGFVGMGWTFERIRESKQR